VFVRFVDICEIVDHQCLYFLFIIICLFLNCDIVRKKNINTKHIVPVKWQNIYKYPDTKSTIHDGQSIQT